MNLKTSVNARAGNQDPYSLVKPLRGGSLSDETLLISWSDGNAQAGNQLFRRHFRPVLSYFERRAQVRAEDLTQETFLACLTARDRFRKRSSFRTFLFAVAKNVLFHDYRRNKRTLLGTAVELGAEANAPGPLLVRKRAQAQLHAALELLEGSDRQALLDYYWGDRRGPELAESLGLSVPALRSRIRRALERLRQEMEVPAGGTREVRMHSHLTVSDRENREIRPLIEDRNGPSRHYPLVS